MIDKDKLYDVERVLAPARVALEPPERTVERASLRFWRDAAAMPIEALSIARRLRLAMIGATATWNITLLGWAVSRIAVHGPTP